MEEGYYADGEDAYMMRKMLTETYNLGLDNDGTALTTAEDKTETEEMKEN